MVTPVSVNEIFWGKQVTNPWAIEAMEPLTPIDDSLPILATVLIALVTIDLVLRWRRAQGVERLQIRWAALGFLVVALLGVGGLTAQAAGLANEFVFVAVWLGFGALPTAVGIAVTRYRLLDIDRLISRTVTYALVVGMLVGVYAGGVILLRGLVPLRGTLAVATSTLVVAALFNPLRRRVQIEVDRRFNRSHYVAQQELEMFAGRLREEIDFDGLIDDLLAVVTKTVQPSTVTVWIRTAEETTPRS
jgi:hypothetical protein